MLTLSLLDLGEMAGKMGDWPGLQGRGIPWGLSLFTNWYRSISSVFWFVLFFGCTGWLVES